MIAAPGLQGVCAAVITPLDEAFSPDGSLAVPYYRDLLSRGCDALNVLGTTGEAMSLPLVQRRAFMEALAGGGLPRDRMMIGTGAPALADAIELTRAAFTIGFAGALVMPPFFYRDASDDGVLQFFDALLGAVDPPRGGVLLYNFPRMSGITFSPHLTRRLVETFGDVIGGVKDSSNDAALQKALGEAHPQLAVFPSSEEDLTKARECGYAGCISGSVALWPELAARVWRGAASEQAALSEKRRRLAGKPLIAEVRRQVAQATGEAAWNRSVPPLMALAEEA